ncbi:MAG: hypothetical protein HRU28_12200, partial [Rhizobiales bacterium]|nr:hypothetical protein [Hyphomicrobiales bacterium]
MFTIIQKFKTPEKSFVSCIPFIDEFSNKNSTSSTTQTLKSDQISTVDYQSKASTNNIIVNDSSDVEADSKKADEISEIKVSTTTKKATIKKPVKTKASSSKKSSKATPKKKSAKKGDNIKKINGIGPVFER